MPSKYSNIQITFHFVHLCEMTDEDLYNLRSDISCNLMYRVPYASSQSHFTIQYVHFTFSQNSVSPSLMEVLCGHSSVPDCTCCQALSERLHSGRCLLKLILLSSLLSLQRRTLACRSVSICKRNYRYLIYFRSRL